MVSRVALQVFVMVLVISDEHTCLLAMSSSLSGFVISPHHHLCVMKRTDVFVAMGSGLSINIILM